MEAATVESTAMVSVTDSSVGEIMMNAPLLAQIDSMAHRMATSKATIPVHLKGSEGDCWAVIMQSVQWRMNPWAVAQKTHLINGTLGYEAQLVNAVITSMAPTKDRLDYEWYGDWSRVLGKFTERESKKEGGGTYKVPAWKADDEQGLGVRVWATMKGEDKPRVLELLLTQAQVRNSTLWASDPRQQLAYLASKRWARLHCPDVLLGVYTPDELQEFPSEREVGPAASAPAAPAAGASRVSSIKNKLKGKGGAVYEGEADLIDDPAPDPAPADKPPLTFAKVAEAINKASDPASLSSAIDKCEEFLSGDGNEEYRSELGALYQARVAMLKKGDS